MITVQKSDIQPALKRLAKVAAKKSTMPILTHIAVDHDGEAMTLTANDLSATYSMTIPASGDPARFTVEAGKLATSVNAMRAGDIVLDAGLVKQSRTRIKLDSMDYDHFPQPDYQAAEDAGCTAEALSDALQAVQHAMAANDVRYYLQGVHLDGENAVATDGHRMAWVPLNCNRSLIIPSESVRQIIGMTGSVAVSDNQLVITGERERFSTKLIEGRFPDWKRVVPSGDAEMTITADREAVMEALRAVAIGDDMVRMDMDNGAAKLSNRGAESGFDCQASGVAEIGFKASYLIDALNLCGDSVTIELRGSNKAVMIDGWQVVMPARL